MSKHQSAEENKEDAFENGGDGDKPQLKESSADNTSVDKVLVNGQDESNKNNSNTVPVVIEGIALA